MVSITEKINEKVSAAEEERLAAEARAKRRVNDEQELQRQQLAKCQEVFPVLGVEEVLGEVNANFLQKKGKTVVKSGMFPVRYRGGGRGYDPGPAEFSTVEQPLVYAALSWAEKRRLVSGQLEQGRYQLTVGVGCKRGKMEAAILVASNYEGYTNAAQFLYNEFEVGVVVRLPQHTKKITIGDVDKVDSELKDEQKVGELKEQVKNGIAEMFLVIFPPGGFNQLEG